MFATNQPHVVAWLSPYIRGSLYVCWLPEALTVQAAVEFVICKFPDL